MRGRILPVLHLSSRDEDAWRELAARAAEPNPLSEPDCVIPAARHQAFGSEIVVVVAEDSDGLRACVPVRPVTEWYGLRYPVMATKIRRSTYVGTPLVDAAAGEKATTTLFTTLIAERRERGYRLLGLDSLRAEGPVAAQVLDAAEDLGLASHHSEDFVRGMWRRRRDDEGYYSGRHGHDIRRQERRLADRLGETPTLRDRSHEEAAIAELIALEAAGYKADTVALTAQPGEPEYFTEMCQRFARAGRLVVLALEAAGQTLAMAIWLRGGQGGFGIKAAYDERYARYSPGTNLHLRSFDYFHGKTDLEWVDTCAGANNDYLLRMYPDRTRITSILFALEGRLDRVVVDHLRLVRRAQREWARVRSGIKPDDRPRALPIPEQASRY